MKSSLVADFGRTSEDYARYRPGFPESFFKRIAVHGVGDTAPGVCDGGEARLRVGRVILNAPVQAAFAACTAD